MARRGFNGGADHQARYNVGALEQRVYGLEQSITGISQQIAGLGQKIDAKGQTNWSVLTGFAIVTISILGLLGNQALSPIKDGQSDLKLAMVEFAKAQSAMPDKYVSIREVDARSARSQTEMVRLNTDLNAQEVNLRRSMEQADTNLQRQIDEQKKAFGDTFNLRDAMQQYRRELDDLRQRVTAR